MKINKVHPIDVGAVDFLTKEKIYDQARTKLTVRMNYIIKTVFHKCGVKLKWWSFEDSEGHDDIHVRQKYLGYENEFDDNPEKLVIIDKDGDELELYSSVPTRWLWEDFEDELTNGIKLFRSKTKEETDKELEEINRQKCILRRAKRKLTKEELELLLETKE